MTRNGRERVDQSVGSGGESPRVRAFYDGKAHSYDRWLDAYERLMMIGAHRDRLLSRAHGRTLEVGVGSGRNLAAYPVDAQVTGIDISPAMLEIAKSRASQLGRVIDLRVGDAQDLDFPDGSFDTAVAILVLSAVPDHHQAIREIKRVLRADGRLLVLDHGRSTIRPVVWAQRAVDPVLARYAQWHFMRELPADLRSAGFSIEAVHRSRLGVLQEIVARR
jgi:ubiquinone/menaquinone biosynthesis C-methylase UbiE